MANELVGVPVTLQFTLANPGAGASTAMTLAGGNGADAILVPTGHVFRPLYLYVESNADLTAGNGTAKVTDDGTVIANGPAPNLADTVQQKEAVGGHTQAAGIAAGHAVGVKFVTDANYLPVTADIDAVLVGMFEPA